jgi:diguanylate cyclase (GGDEF)-like protein/PAS domain S-box-containing protein
MTVSGTRVSDERHFQALAERGADLALVCTAEMVIAYAGPSLREMFGYAPEQVVGSSGWVFVHPEDVETFRRRWQAALDLPGSHERVVVRVRHQDGSWRWVEQRITNRLDDPHVAGMVLNVRDVTDEREMADTLADSEQLHRSILEAAQEGVWVTDLHGRTLFSNAKMAEVLGTTSTALAAGYVWDFFQGDTLLVVRERIARRAVGVREQYELPVEQTDNSIKWLLVNGSPLYGARGAHVANIAMFTDITSRKEMENDLRRMALYDKLTGLPNRTLLMERLARLAEERKRGGPDFVVLLCNVDRFKVVNDGRGQEVGDQLLTKVAKRLVEAAREVDTVARLSGDEFAVLCPGADGYAGQRIAESLRQAFDSPFDVAGVRLDLTASLGVATSADTAVEHLLRAADMAVYQAKERGRGQVVVHSSLGVGGFGDRLSLVTDLREALEAGRLQIWYQPIVQLGSSQPCGVEALMRWNHPVHGLVPPSLFIPVAEDAGLMPQLGRWSLRTACADAMNRLPVDADWHVAVNLSGPEFADRDLVQVVRDTLRTSGLPPARLMLEMTETALLADVEAAVSTLHELKKLGVGLALDDFGTGYSSLAYLRRFPVDQIKIDRSFVAGLGVNGDDSAIVASLVSLAAAVGIQAVAEGVESAQQEDILRRLGCPLGQGFLWSPAVPVGELAEVAARLRQAAGRDTVLGANRRRARLDAGRPAEADAARIMALHAGGASPTSIAAALNADGLRTPDGHRWHRNSVARVIAVRQFPELRL